MSVDVCLGRGVDGGQRGGGVDHGQRGDDRLRPVGDGNRGGSVVDDRAKGGVRVSLDGAVGEVTAHALGLHHGAVQARCSDQSRGRSGVHGGGRYQGRCGVVSQYSGFGCGQGDGGQQQRYHNNLSAKIILYISVLVV